MNLLLRTVVSFRRLATPDAAFTLLVLFILIGVEVLGRQATADVHDLIAAGALGVLAMLVLARNRQSRLPWVGAFHSRLRGFGRVLWKSTFQIGIDLRGTPPVKRGYPPAVKTLIAGFAVALMILAPFLGHFPHGLRAAGTRVFYLGYLASVVGLWLAALTMILLAVLFQTAMIHDAFVAAHRVSGRRRRRPELAAILAYFGAWLLLGLYLPLYVAPLLCVVFLTIALAIAGVAGRGEVQFLWRPRESIQVRSLTWGRWVTCEYTVITLALLTLTVAACGGMIVDPVNAPETMPVTSLLGVTLAWLSPGLVGALLLHMVSGRLNDPARPARRTAWVNDPAGLAQRGDLRRLFAQRGWSVRFGPKSPRPMDVAIELVDQPLPFERVEPSWPLAVSPEDLWRPGLFVRLGRRDEIQKRRRFLTALERLLKQATGRRRSGSGYWLAPHFWFVHGLMRDGHGSGDDEFDFSDDAVLTDMLGTPYSRSLGRPVRHYLYCVLRAVRVDLIFIEDGLSFRRLRRALRVVFEVYDKYQGRRPAEEIDFRGLPGTRVLIHDYQFDEPFRSNEYPEPKYDMIGRARILHVFRDRGDQEELIEPPYDFSHRPAPVGIGG